MIVLPKFTENGIFVSITSWSYTFVPFNGWKQKKVRNKLMCFADLPIILKAKIRFSFFSYMQTSVQIEQYRLHNVDH